jgi:1-acyl-sn-glycerol-3-phosphate acyltransferase
VAELAVRSGVPVVPLGIIYKDNNPPALPVRLNIGQPLYFKKSENCQNLREITDEIMREIAKLSGKSYGN